MDTLQLADTFRRRALPWLIWVGLALGAYLAWQSMGLGMTVKGFAEALPYRLTSVEPARVESILVKVGDRVSAGQVVAVLDARTIEGELKAAVAGRAAVLAEMTKAELEARKTYGDSVRNLSNTEATSERTHREAKTRLETARAELQAVQAELARRKRAVAEGAMRASDLTDLEIRLAALKRAVAEETAAVALYATRAGQDAPAVPTLEEWIQSARAPLERQLEVFDGQVRTLEARRDQRILRSPVEGQVVAVHGQADGVAVPDLPLVEIVTDTPGRIIACVAEELHAPVAVGMKATARPRSKQSLALNGTTVSVTSVIELPSRCWRTPQIPSWGRLVAVELSPAVTLVPGETFDVAFEPADGI